MGAIMNNFPTGELIFPERLSYDFTFEAASALTKTNLQLVKKIKGFDQILLDKELAKEMFPPDYFMLVE